MPTFEVVYLVQHKVRVTATDLADAAGQAKRMVYANDPAKLVSVHLYPYVELPKEPEPKLGLPRDCQCPDCASEAAFSEWYEILFGHLHKPGPDPAPTKGGGGPKRAA